jgi:hypothetical protein
MSSLEFVQADAPARVTEASIFKAAFLGALLARVVGLVDREKGLHLPGDGSTYLVAGWFVIILVVALGAGYVAAYVWRERDMARAFLFGVGFVYLLTGGTSDLGKLAPKSAFGQTPPVAPAPIGTIVVKLKNGIAPAAQRFEIRTLAQGSSKPAVVSTTKTFPYTLTVPSGSYRVEAVSPEYAGDQWVTVSDGQTVEAVITIHPRRGWRDFFEGVKRGATAR